MSTLTTKEQLQLAVDDLCAVTTRWAREHKLDLDIAITACALNLHGALLAGTIHGLLEPDFRQKILELVAGGRTVNSAVMPIMGDHDGSTTH